MCDVDELARGMRRAAEESEALMNVEGKTRRDATRLEIQIA